MRSLDNAIAEKDLEKLDYKLTGRDIWDALHKEFPNITLKQRTRVINYLIFHLQDDIVSPQTLYNELGKFRGRTIDYLGKQGVLTDVGWVGSDQVYHMVIDGCLFGAAFDAIIRVLPEQPEPAVETNETERTLHYVDYIRSFSDQFFGKFVELPARHPNPPTQGILTDIWRSATNKDHYLLVVDGKLYLEAGDSLLAVWTNRKVSNA